jgi:hypothetical protein
MVNGRPYRRGSLGGGLILVALGVLFLYANFRPELDPWEVLFRYWPVIVIFIGVGMLVDYFVRGSSAASHGLFIGGEIAGLIVLLLFFAFVMRESEWGHKLEHISSSVERQGADSEEISIEMPAGELKVSGGASQLLDADFAYASWEAKPEVSYSVSGGKGDLAITQDHIEHIHFGGGSNRWNLKFNNDVPMGMRVSMGAGKGDLKLSGLNLTSLDVEMGAGRLDADLTGEWKKDANVTIEGGVGSATIHLPKDVGVDVEASGGIGAVRTRGLHEQDGEYVNDAYRKSPITLRVNVQGGVGHILLVSE